MRILTSIGLLAALAACGVPPTAPTSQPTQNTGPLVMSDGLGNQHDVDAILGSGKSVALVFWQTWCTTCREEGPALAQAAKTLDNYRFFGVVSGGDDVVKQSELDQVTAQLELPYPQVRDRDGTLAERFRVVGTPTIIVLGPGGKERYRGSRLPADWNRLDHP